MIEYSRSLTKTMFIDLSITGIGVGRNIKWNDTLSQSPSTKSMSQSNSNSSSSSSGSTSTPAQPPPVKRDDVKEADDRKREKELKEAEEDRREKYADPPSYDEYESDDPDKWKGMEN